MGFRYHTYTINIRYLNQAKLTNRISDPMIYRTISLYIYLIQRKHLSRIPDDNKIGIIYIEKTNQYEGSIYLSFCRSIDRNVADKNKSVSLSKILLTWKSSFFSCLFRTGLRRGCIYRQWRD